MKHLLAVFIVFMSSMLQAQNFENLWTGYFSFVSVKSISQGNDKIYGASENSIFTYDLSTKEIATISTINGLSGELISTIYYSESNNLLVIGYENGLIEIVIDDEENVLSVVDILDKPTIPPDRKKINHFSEHNGNLYIATQFGISVYNLGTLEFGDTYFIGDLGTQINITQTTVQDPYIFAATSQNGIRRALVEDDNLIDFQNWTTIANGGFNGLQALQDDLYVLNTANSVLRMTVDGILSNVTNFNSNVVDFKSNNDLLTITTTNTIQAYSDGFVLEASVNSIPDLTYELQSGYAFNNYFYLGTTAIGMFEIPFGSNTGEQILPDGPILNRSFAIDASPGQLWTVFGEF